MSMRRATEGETTWWCSAFSWSLNGNVILPSHKTVLVTLVTANISRVLLNSFNHSTSRCITHNWLQCHLNVSFAILHTLLQNLWRCLSGSLDFLASMFRMLSQWEIPWWALSECYTGLATKLTALGIPWPLSRQHGADQSWRSLLLPHVCARLLLGFTVNPFSRQNPLGFVWSSVSYSRSWCSCHYCWLLNNIS